MTDRPRSPETGDDGGMAYDRESTTGIPRWMRVVGIILAVVALLFVAVLLGGGVGDHGPSRHGSGGSGGQAPPSSVT